MLIYCYDGSFDGLLTAIYESYYTSKPDHIYVMNDYQQHLADQVLYIETDYLKAEKVSKAMNVKFKPETFEHILYAYLSENVDAADAIHAFLRLAFAKGDGVIDNESDERVRILRKLSRSVVRESHKFLGMTRFKLLKSGIYYCEFEPTYNLLMLLAPHFSRRMMNQSWVIHDKKRGIAAVYNQDEWFINEFDNHIEIMLDEEEELFQSLWQEYYNRIAIKERINPKLQMQMMPQKYWHYLIEMRGKA